MARKTPEAPEVEDVTPEEATPDVETTDHDPETGEAPETEAETDEDDVEIGDAEWSPDVDSLDLDTLSGDIRDVMLQQFRRFPKTWQQMTEAEQRMTAEGIDYGARQLVRKAVRMVASYEWPHCVVTLGEVKIKGEKGIEAKIGAANVEENRNVLGDYVGSYAMLVMVDSETFMAARGEIQIDPDQPELPAGDEPAPEEEAEAPAEPEIADADDETEAEEKAEELVSGWNDVESAEAVRVEEGG